jgi:hypothetical protein
MVFITKLFSAAAIVAASIGSASADLKITSPTADKWWVAQSQNLISWTCKDTTVQSFTVLVGNQDPKISVAPLAIIPVQQNFQCSILVTQDQANQPAGTGWQIFFADVLNITNYLAISDPFEIKPIGSAYPAQTTTDVSVATGTASGSGSGTAPSATTTPKSGAASLVPHSVWAAAGAGLGALALVLA